MKPKESEFEKFDRVMGGLLTVPYAELQKKLEAAQRVKQKKKKRPTSTASSRASSSRKKRAA
jgi:hypothetical protein